MDIHQLIAAIVPDVFCDGKARREVKNILSEAAKRKESSGCFNAAEKAQPLEPNRIAVEHLEDENPFRLPGFKSPIEQHTLAYDSFDESLEAFYFWLLDELTADGWDVSKLADTFLATPGSGLFAELTRRESRAQQEAAKLLREAHALVGDILRTASFLKKENEFTGEKRGWTDSIANRAGLVAFKNRIVETVCALAGTVFEAGASVGTKRKGAGITGQPV